jgi:hypothetical protein
MAANTKIYRTEEGKDLYAVMAEFATPADTYHAAEKVRDAGYQKWDVYSPFPIHGIEEAMGLKRPILPLLVGILGITGACLGFGFQYWVSTVGYKTNVQGKPYGAWEAFVPVTFEIGVLFTAFTALFGMLVINGLPRWNHPLLCKERFLGVSDDKFIIAIESADAKFEPEQVRRMFKDAGATAVELVEDIADAAPPAGAH